MKVVLLTVLDKGGKLDVSKIQDYILLKFIDIVINWGSSGRRFESSHPDHFFNYLEKYTEWSWR